jgi:hypothetical protein
MKTFVLTDESLNNYGFWLPLSGAVLDQFKKNPVMLWMHNRAWRGTKDEILPIGYWDNIRIEGKKLLADAVFDENDEFAAAIMDKVENDFLRMASCGLRVIETSQDPKWLKPGQTCETPIKWTLKEASICDIGANDNALSLVFYDENDKMINLAENSEGSPLKKLADNSTVTQTEISNMKKLLSFFKLSDESTEDQVLAKVSGLQESLTLAEAAKLKAEEKLADYVKKEGEARKAEAVTLLDAAVKDGRLSADSRKPWESLFESNHDSAKLSLAAMPVRQSVKDRLADNGKGNETERGQFEKLSWDELDKQGKLAAVKEKYLDLYEEKFEGKFGVKPNKA